MIYTVIVLVFVLAGAVKGVIGLGLPTISLALLSLVIDLPGAMALLLVPSLVTNIWQMFDGQNTWMLFKRIWVFLICATVTVWIGALALNRFDTRILSAVLGVLLVTYALLGLTGIRFSISFNKERWVGPVAGIFNGVLTGMTGSFVVPGVMYLQSIGLPRDSLFQAMGMLFTVSTLALGVALGSNGLLSIELSMQSAFAVIPAIIGMLIGSKLRKHLPEARFRRLFFLALLALGIYIFSSNLFT